MHFTYRYKHGHNETATTAKADEAGAPADEIVPTNDVEVLPPDKAEEHLARLLQKKMEHLDPRGETWEMLSEREKIFYRCCIETLLVSGLVKLASTTE